MIRRSLVALLLALAFAAPALAAGRVSVRGHFRKDGTYVRPHTRSAPHARAALPSGPPLVARSQARTAPPAAEAESHHAAEPGDAARTSRAEPDLAVKTLTPPAGRRLVIALTDKALDQYTSAWSRGRDAEANQLIAYKDVMIVREPIKVRVEGAYEGKTYVRILDGPNARKLYLAESKYVK